MEYSYFGFGDLMTGENTYDWKMVEDALVYVKSVGKQLIMRPYISYPKQGTSMPSFLVQNCGTTCVNMYSYSDYGGGTIPDWTNAKLTR